MVEHAFDAAIQADNYRILSQSLRLFRQYIEAITDGMAPVEVELLPLPDYCQRTAAQYVDGTPYALDSEGFEEVWDHVPADVVARTDWWWVLYPSHVPDDTPEIGNLPWLTGGMSVGRDGCSPVFGIDDHWLTRRPSGLGQGAYTNVERRLYLPQWLQHEFFHHSFRRWPEFELEAEDHQWFDGDNWPADFNGIFEADYYAESLDRRLRTATPNLSVGLRCAPPSRAQWQAVPADGITGTYERRPVGNEYHRGTIQAADGAFRWANEAGVSWTLAPTPAGVLTLGTDNPYAGDEGSHAFQLELVRDETGAFTQEIAGFRFMGEFYTRVVD